LNELREKNADIILISDTRIAKEIEPIVKAEWGGKVNFASFTSQARGVAIFFKKEFPIDIIENSIYNDKSGNFTTLNFKFEEFIINLKLHIRPK
jgi:exonuclease III